MNLKNKLQSIGACKEACEWVGERNDLGQLWAECERGDWMAWLISKVLNWPVNSDAHRKMARIKAEIALEVVGIYEAKYPNDNRPRKAIEAAVAYADGDNYAADAAADASHAAAADASAYAAAAYASADAAYASAAYASAYAASAYAAAAAYASAYAAAAYAAAYSAAAYASAYAARKKMRAKIADIIRTHYTASQIREAMEI